jgi:hypothetical protein
MKYALFLSFCLLAMLPVETGWAKSSGKYAPFTVDASNSAILNIADSAVIRKYGPVFKAHGRDVTATMDWDYVVQLILNRDDEDLASEPGVAFNVAEDVYKVELVTAANVERFMKFVLPIVANPQKLDSLLKYYEPAK